VRWSSRISAREATALRSSDESARLEIGRRLGWDAVPSNDFSVKKASGYVILEGIGQGHGIGLCQSGAKAMARQGLGFRRILSHYYPNTTIISWPNVPLSGRTHLVDSGKSQPEMPQLPRCDSSPSYG
jgi:SpoIID/LytB domain protein